MTVNGFDAEISHRRFVELAGAFSPALAADLLAVGSLAPPAPDDVPPVLFLARAVVGQQLSTRVARAIWARVEAMATADGAAAPAAFRPANAEVLRACGLSAAKVKTLVALREADLAGALEPGLLAAMPTAQRSRHLQAIWGIGPWTCDMAAIFHFGDPDVWPEGDLAVRNTFARYVGRRKPATTAGRFAPQRSLLALYLWRILDAVPAQRGPVIP